MRRRAGKVAAIAASGVAASIQSQLLDAVVAALGGNAVGAYRCRMAAFEQTELPADNVLPQSETAEYTDTDSIDCAHRFTVRHEMAKADGVDVAVDARYVRGQKLILADPTLGGLATVTRYIGRKWEFERGEVEVVALVVTYESEFSTARGDPSSPAYL